jgi:protein-disulfide isomerase
MSRLLHPLGLVLAALLTVAAAKANWNNTVALTPVGSHVLGNPAAKVRLTEYVSYTCPHCAEFEVESSAALRLGYVHGGRLTIEVRHVVRNPIDLTAALLSNCSPKERFFLNHAAFLRSQSRWMAIAARATKAQQARWTSGPLPQRTRAIAGDLGFYAIMTGRGYDRMTIDRCLSDQAMATRLANQSKLADEAGVHATPSFALDGMLLAATHDWALLRPQLEARY